MSTLLGTTTPRCPGGLPRTDTACGRLLAAAAKLVDTVDAALDSMPKTGEYAKVSDAVSSFRKSYGTVESAGCYTAHPASGVTDEFCSQLADLVTLSWLNLRSQIAQLATAGDE